MRNFVEPGDAPDVVFPRAVASGGAVLIGPGLFGVASLDTANNATAPLRVVGVFDLAKAAVAVTAGAKLYWDNTAFLLTTVASGNTYVASAVRPAATNDTTVRALLRGLPV